jgi:hypothetical protein
MKKKYGKFMCSKLEYAFYFYLHCFLTLYLTFQYFIVKVKIVPVTGREGP